MIFHRSPIRVEECSSPAILRCGVGWDRKNAGEKGGVMSG